MNISTISTSAPAAPAAAERKAGTAPQGATAATASGEAAEVAKGQPEKNLQQLPEALERINTVLQIRSPDLQFSVDDDSARTIVKVIDTKTGELIRQMPSKEALEIAKALERLDGLLIRDKA